MARLYIAILRLKPFYGLPRLVAKCCGKSWESPYKQNRTRLCRALRARGVARAGLLTATNSLPFVAEQAAGMET
eukprot:11189008-Alexandrium_andersonii.AAC.1